MPEPVVHGEVDGVVDEPPRVLSVQLADLPGPSVGADDHLDIVDPDTVRVAVRARRRQTHQYRCPGRNSGHVLDEKQKRVAVFDVCS